MSVRINSRVWEHSQAKGATLLLLLAIADEASDDGVAEAKITHLAKKCRLTKRAISYQIATLQKLSELKVRIGKGRGNGNLYVVTVKESMQTLHALEDVKHAKSCTQNMQNPAPIYSVKRSVINKTNNARAGMHAHAHVHAREGVSEKSSPFPIPTLAEFTEKFFDAELASWIEENAPAVMPQQVTARFIEHHQTENTQFKSAAAMLRAWRGYMRNAQAKAVERSEAKATRKEQGHGTTRKADARRAGGESRSFANLRATVEQFGLPDSDLPRVNGSDGIREYARKVALAKRAARPGAK